ncbi:MAG: type II secretion system protein [Desulfobacteraceae bacterium]|nr:type II secretion system protein [Desulfobacteraceae bacterium]
MNKLKKISGFTLIELIVVICIVSILLGFSYPMFRDVDLFSNSATQLGDIVRLINNLKKRAVEQNTDFLLHMDTTSGSLWVTNTGMNDEAIDQAKQKGIQLSDKIIILDVEFPGIKEVGEKEYQIRFSKSGYSDYALIHIGEGDNTITLKIEPFLSQVQLLDEHVYLEDCI